MFVIESRQLEGGREEGCITKFYRSIRERHGALLRAIEVAIRETWSSAKSHIEEGMRKNNRDERLFRKFAGGIHLRTGVNPD